LILPVRSGLCTSSQLGTFITSSPGGSTNSTSVFTTALRFSTSSPSSTTEGDPYDPEPAEDEEDEYFSATASMTSTSTAAGAVGTAIDDIDDGFLGDSTVEGDAADEEDGYDGEGFGDVANALSDTFAKVPPGTRRKRQTENGSVPVYSSPITYSVSKTGYYCVGMSFLTELRPAELTSQVSFQSRSSTLVHWANARRPTPNTPALCSSATSSTVNCQR
jgi:hypothetical protein